MLFQENNFTWACNQVCSFFNKTNYPLFLCLLLSRFLHFLSHSVDRTESVWADCTIQAECRNLQGKQAHTKLAREHSSTQFSSLGHCRHFGIKQWKWSVYADLNLKNQILQVVVVRVVVVYFVFVFFFPPWLQRRQSCHNSQRMNFRGRKDVSKNLMLHPIRLPSISLWLLVDWSENLSVGLHKKKKWLACTIFKTITSHTVCYCVCK